MVKSVALCLSGHMRSYEQCFPSLKQYVIDPLKADVFISTWDTLGYWKQLTNDELNSKKVSLNELGFDESGKVNEDNVRHLYDPVVLKVHSFSEKDSYFTQYANLFSKYIDADKWYYRLKNFYSMYWKAYNCLDHCKQVSECIYGYDLVIRTRPDLMFNSSLPFIDNYDKGYLYVCDNYAERGTLGDIFFAGSIDNLIKYHSVIYNLEELLSVNKVFNPHQLVRSQLEFRDIPYKVIHLNVSLNNSKNKYCEQGKF